MKAIKRAIFFPAYLADIERLFPTWLPEKMPGAAGKSNLKKTDNGMGECNELIVGMSQFRNLYLASEDSKICKELIDSSGKTGRRHCKLEVSWSKFKSKKFP